MNKQNTLFWIFVVISALLGFAITGLGISLYINGRDCLSYNDYACAFSAMFSFIVIPYGFAILLFVGLASLPYKITRLVGSVFSALLGIVHVGLCCVITLGAASNAGDSFISEEMGSFLLFPFGIFLGGLALLGVGIIGYLRTK